LSPAPSDDLEADGDGEDTGPIPAVAVSARPTLATFDDVIRLASRKRDPRLKIALEDAVRLVRFEPGRIELNLLAAAQPTLANELSDKLSRWTGERWVVAVSRETGERPRGEVRRECEAAELAELTEHPAVQAVLTTFPGSQIKEIRTLEAPEFDTGAEGRDGPWPNGQMGSGDA
jgi:DNA polymerase-3 subunit gamma/tau